MTTTQTTPLITVTDAAQEMVLSVRAQEPNPDTLALWVEISGVNGNSYTYDIYFQAAADAEADDALLGPESLPIVVRAESVDRLRGATLDVIGGGMVMSNPNAPEPPRNPLLDRAGADLSGPVAQAVIAVIDSQINPAIASHGGQARLVAVEDGTAYLQLGGGCQGCSSAAVTLTQGIEVAILDAVPEITRVLDVTDHAGGTNPYFTADGHGH
jgi:Fe/S biogenesis protein NfuA